MNASQKSVVRMSRLPSGIHRQNGASLLEGIAYLGIAAIVVLGAVSLLTGAFSSAKSNQLIEEVVAIRTATRKLYIGQTYPTDISTTLAAAKALPATIANSNTGTGMTNSWGGAVTIAGTGGTFTITYAQVPLDVCISSLAGANGWTQVQGAAAVTDFPVTTANASTACGATSPVANLVFTAS